MEPYGALLSPCVARLTHTEEPRSLSLSLSPLPLPPLGSAFGLFGAWGSLLRVSCFVPWSLAPVALPLLVCVFVVRGRRLRRLGVSVALCCFGPRPCGPAFAPFWGLCPFVAPCFLSVALVLVVSVMVLFGALA